MPRWIARNLDQNTVGQIAPDTWVLWTETTEYYRGWGYRGGTKPPQTGDLLVQSPYVDWFNLTWGLAPNSDMPKWRYMYRARPEIRQGIDLMVILAVGKGFSITCENKEIEEYANRLMNHLGMRDVLQMAVSDMLVYGQAWFEKIRTKASERQEYEDLELAPIEKRVEAHQIEEPMLARRWWEAGDPFDEDDPEKMKGVVKDYINDGRSMDRWISRNQKVLTPMFVGMKRQLTQFLAKAEKTTKAKWKAAMQQVPPQGGIRPPPGAMGGGAAFGFAPPGAMGNPRPATQGTQEPVVMGSVDEMRKEIVEPEEGELVELKPIDPMWMRVNRDSFNNTIGYVQWGLTPIPQGIVTEKIVYLKWMPKSWAYENAYGTSVLMPVQRHVSLLIQAEEDMKVFWHQYAKPMLVVNGGTEDKPYPLPALQNLQAKFAARQPNTDAVVPGDVKVQMVQSGTAKTAMTYQVWAMYLREKIYETLGIPDVLMNLPGEQTRATSDVTLQAFVAKEQMIQDIVGEQFLKQVIEPEVRRHFSGKFPDEELTGMKITWPPILTEDRNKIADRVIKSVGRPIETVNEGRAELGLGPRTEPEYDEIAEAPAGPLGGTNPANPPPSKNPEESESVRTGPGEESKANLDKGNTQR
ncbi:MAG TPA: phage portal protein [Nitrososphaerales archaeon]|nr:phage portal protein [Nitrososphaerales archaeon]